MHHCRPEFFLASVVLVLKLVDLSDMTVDVSDKESANSVRSEVRISPAEK